MKKNDAVKSRVYRISTIMGFLVFLMAIPFVGCDNAIATAVTKMQTEAKSPRFILSDAESAKVAANGTLNFPATSVGGSYDLSLTIKNTGNSELTIEVSNISIAMGSNTEEGSFSIKTTPPKKIATGEDALFELTFSPQTLGVKTATISIPTNDIKNPKFTFTVQGSCVTGSKDITAFSFVTPAATGLISGTSINVNVPIGTNTASLVATFATTGVTVTVNGIPQTSGATAVDFTSSPITYIVTADDATTKTYAVTVTVGATIPVLTTASITGTTWTSASGGGSVSNDGGAEVKERGICWNTSPDPTIANSVQKSTTTGTGSFTACSLTNLLPGTDYYVRAYATNGAGTGYGASVSFTTNAASAPTTTAPSAINAKTAVAGGTTVAANSGLTIIQRGLCWSTNPNPTIAGSKNIDGLTTVGAFTSTLSALLPATTYYMRAYVTLSNGTASCTVYGNELTLQTAGYTAPDGVGIVFYDQGSVINGWRYLEAAPVAQDSAATWWTAAWVTGTVAETYFNAIATSPGIGTGDTNTTNIITAQGGATGHPAYICRNYGGGLHTDWYLPSRDELGLLWLNLYSNGIGGFTEVQYWSSTTGNAGPTSGNAWYKFFNTGGTLNLYWTTYSYRVRAVRKY